VRGGPRRLTAVVTGGRVYLFGGADPHPLLEQLPTRPRETCRLESATSMSTNLYLFFDPTELGATLPACIGDLLVPGFTRFEQGPHGNIEVANEQPAPVRLMFFTQNYFRIFVADLALKFYREAPPPPEVTAGERALRDAVTQLDALRLRRWLLVREWWDDDDNACVEVLADGTDVRGLEDSP
jgi:hypothetical protein